MRRIRPPERSASTAGIRLPSPAGSGCFGPCRSCSSRLPANGPAGGVGGQLDPVGVAELLEHVLEVRSNGAARNEELLGDVPVGAPLGHQPHYPELAGGEARPSGRRTASGPTR